MFFANLVRPRRSPVPFLSSDTPSRLRTGLQKTLAAMLALTLFVLPACDMTPAEPKRPDPPTDVDARWSDTDTWDGRLPQSGEAVTIPEGETYLLDTSTPSLGALTIKGTLVFADEEVELRAERILVEGALYVGLSDKPQRKRATITLTGEDPGALGSGKLLTVTAGGILEMHGDRREALAWTQIDGTAPSGQQHVRLATAPQGWKAGDQVVIAPSSVDPGQAEVKTLASISGRQLSFEEGLQHQHFGEKLTYGPYTQEYTIDERAEVGLLSRSIVVRGDSSSARSGYGGRLLVDSGARARIEGVEFYRMGQQDRSTGYALYWSSRGNASGDYFRDNSIHETYNRGLSLRNTSQFEIRDNVAFDILGHAFSVEAGTENQLKGNLGVNVQTADDPATSSDASPAVFRITHPSNHLVGNTAAGVRGGYGFWVNLSGDVTFESLGDFRDNTAHSTVAAVDGSDSTATGIGGRGLFVDRYSANDPASRIKGFTSYKNNRVGLWVESGLRIEGARLADNRDGVVASGGLVFSSLIVGQSRALQTSFDRTQGVQFYKEATNLKAITFANFPGPYGAIGWHPSRRTGGQLPPGWVEALEFVSTEPAYFEASSRWEKNQRTFILHDRDGSIGQTPGYLVYGAEVLWDDECTTGEQEEGVFCPEPHYYMAAQAEAKTDVAYKRSDGATARAGDQNINLLGGETYQIETSETVSEVTSGIELRGLTPGQGIEVKLPWSQQKAFIQRGNNYLNGDSTLTQLRQSTKNGFYLDRDNNRLHIATSLEANDDEGNGDQEIFRTRLTWCLRLRCTDPFISGAPPPDYSGGGNGLTGKYYDVRYQKRDFTPNAEDLRTTRIDPVIAFDWQGEIPPGTNLTDDDRFTVRWTGQVEAPETGEYTISSAHEDGVRLRVGDSLVVDTWDQQNRLRTRGKAVPLEGGQKYDVTMDYFINGNGNAGAELSWAYGPYRSHHIPTEHLYSD